MGAGSLRQDGGRGLCVCVCVCVCAAELRRGLEWGPWGGREPGLTEGRQRELEEGDG